MAKNGIDAMSVMSEKTNHPLVMASKPAGPDACARSVGTSHTETGSRRFANDEDGLVFKTEITVAGTHLKRSSPKNQNAPGRAPVNVPSAPSIPYSITSQYAALSTSSPIENNVCSPPYGAMIWNPTGRSFPSRTTLPLGTEIAGTPARFTGTVKISAAYIASGSSDFSPILNPGVGDVGITMASTPSAEGSNARLKSSRISSRTARAFR